MTDDWQELNRVPGELHLIDSIDVTGKTITLTSPVSPTNFPTVAGQTIPYRHTRLTRWDQSGKIYLSDGATVWTDLGVAGSTGDIPVPPIGTTLLLENGITVAFSSNPTNGPLYTGDYWSFSARTADGSVEPLVQCYPRGIQHHFCRLGIVKFDDNPWTIQDCRQLFPPLADPGVHVTGVVLSTGVPLLNDGTIPLSIGSSSGVQADLAHGINVVCDAPLDPATVTQPGSTAAGNAQATCYVIVNAPALSAGSVLPVIGFSPLMLQAQVSLDSSQTIIQWTPQSTSINGLANQMAAANFAPVLARLTLKGNFIWASGNPQAYLEGNVLGTPYTDSSGTQHTGLDLPSGLSRRGGDFDMWFWLTSTPPVSVSATSLDFGNQLVGTASAGQTVTLTNNNANNVSISVTGADAADFTQTNTCAGVAAGQSCTITVTFTPAQTGVRSAQLSIGAGAPPVAVATVALTGTGIQPGLSPSATSLAFGLVTVGSVSVPQMVTLTNGGSASLTLSDISISGSFTQTNTAGPTPSTLAPGASCTVTVQFVPASSGALSGILTIASNAPASPLTIALTGTGVAKTKDSKDSKDPGDSKLSKDARDKHTVLDKITDRKTAVLEQVTITNGVNQTLVSSFAAQQLESRDEKAEGTRAAFIQPEERPAVGVRARNTPDKEKSE
jgi:hypothetical protein